MPRRLTAAYVFAASLLSVFAFALAAAPAALAQTRPALTRDVDNPALQPYRTVISVSVPNGLSSTTVDGPLVPAGKRLVIENVSVWGFGPDTDEFTGVWLTVPSATPATFVLLDPNSTERRVLPGGSFVSAYNRQVKLYFNAGEQVQAQVFTRGSAGARLLNIYLQGSLITP